MRAGPPPRMRGRRRTPAISQHHAGTTPAHAGKTTVKVVAAPPAEDHPRACGEDPEAEAILDAAGRTTPAHAGKTPRPPPPRRPTWDHPRACGEDQVAEVPRQPVPGPPPRMRGRPTLPLRLHRRARTTPAHAGKTKRRWHAKRNLPDHPRACGEDPSPPPQWFLHQGPPPRMRGRQLEYLAIEVGVRTTPAHAGKTPVPVRSAGEFWDHPRACGEDDIYQKKNGRYAGPPPRMRGRLGWGCR